MVEGKDRGKARCGQAGKDRKQEERSRTARITAGTRYGQCSERLTAFGGLLALVKFLKLIEFEETFQRYYVAPKRKTKLGGYRMVLGILMLLFIGFQRLWHFNYIRDDSMLCGILRIPVLPAVSTYWRYIQSMRIMQSQSLLRLAAKLRSQVWALCEYRPKRVTVNIDTTASTVYGNIEGAQQGHNKKRPGKKMLRPVFCFLAETREYLCGSQRRGKTILNKEVARQIKQLGRFLPSCVKVVKVHADAEFIGWESVKACEQRGYRFTFANKRSNPPFPEDGWYWAEGFEHNECVYQPHGWEKPYRWVVRRIPEANQGRRQMHLLDSENYRYRIFATNEKMRPHKVVCDYDLRADAENLIGEAQGEGIMAIASKRFQANHAFFQLVMLAYNLWRWMKMLAAHAQSKQQASLPAEKQRPVRIQNHTIRIARLKMLFVAAKIRTHSNRDDVIYSYHETRAAGIIDLLRYFDQGLRAQRGVS